MSESELFWNLHFKKKNDRVASNAFFVELCNVMLNLLNIPDHICQTKDRSRQFILVYIFMLKLTHNILSRVVYTITVYH